MQRADIRFASGDADCAAWLYRPEGMSHAPLLDIRRQLADWAAALAYARSLQGIDREAIERAVGDQLDFLRRHLRA